MVPVRFGHEEHARSPRERRPTGPRCRRSAGRCRRATGRRAPSRAAARRRRSRRPRARPSRRRAAAPAAPVRPAPARRRRCRGRGSTASCAGRPARRRRAAWPGGARRSWPARPGPRPAPSRRRCRHRSCAAASMLGVGAAGREDEEHVPEPFLVGPVGLDQRRPGRPRSQCPFRTVRPATRTIPPGTGGYPLTDAGMGIDRLAQPGPVQLGQRDLRPSGLQRGPIGVRATGHDMPDPRGGRTAGSQTAPPRQRAG